MEHRNATYNARGTIDCEINHPVLGWVPYTLDPEDTDKSIDNQVLLESIGDDIAAYVSPPAITLSEWRETAFVPKEEFLANAVAFQILSDVEAEQAINGWPTTWDSFLAPKTAVERIRIRGKWARVQNVYRNDPTILALQAHASLTDEQVDALFGQEPSGQ